MYTRTTLETVYKNYTRSCIQELHKKLYTRTTLEYVYTNYTRICIHELH